MGGAFLLKVGDGGIPPSYATIAGLRTTSEEWAHDTLRVSGSGIFTGSAGEARLKTNALTGLLDDYELVFEDGSTVRGRFLVTRLDYAGVQHGERSYRVGLESSGKVERP